MVPDTDHRSVSSLRPLPTCRPHAEAAVRPDGQSAEVDQLLVRGPGGGGGGPAEHQVSADHPQTEPVRGVMIQGLPQYYSQHENEDDDDQ